MLIALGISFLAGVMGTVLGGILVSLIKSPNKNLPGIMMGFSGGIMLSIVLFDMFPHAFEGDGGVLVPIVSIALGIIVLHVFHEILPGHEHKDAHAFQSSMRNTSIMMLAGIIMHNLPEGIAIGSALSHGEISMGNYGVSLALLLLFHNIPEGIALAIPLKLSGSRTKGLIGTTALAGLPVVLGTGIGYLVGGISETFLNVCIAFAGGGMLYITVRELLPDAMGLTRSRNGILSIAFGLAVGFLLVFVIGHLSGHSH